jgi:hypothetical protein
MKVRLKTVQQTCPTYDRICPVLADISGKIVEYVRSTQKPSSQLWFLSYEVLNWMKLGHKGQLNTRNKFQKRFFLNPKISLPILDELEESRFWRKQERSAKLKGLGP